MSGDEAKKVIVLSTLFPSDAAPGAGVFIRERMFRVAQYLPTVIVAPQPWFPFQGILRRFMPHFRPAAPRHEIQDGIEVLRPRFFSIPALFKSLDGMFLALSVVWTLRKLSGRFDFDVIDAHFGYPDGYAAVKVGRWLNRPVSITLRGTEPRHSRTPLVRGRLKWALDHADRLFTVSESLRQHALSMGVGPPERLLVVGNGVDADKFFPLDKTESRGAFSISDDAQVLVTVGGLVERKGFHRVIELLPKLSVRHPRLHYLVVGGASAEGDWSNRLRQQVADLGLDGRVSFLGSVPHDAIKQALSASDVFVLSTRNEGWANVILEAMACGLPVITTDVGGNAEVVTDLSLGNIVPFGDSDALLEALDRALSAEWNRGQIRSYARANSWDQRISVLVPELERIAREANGS